MQEVKKLAVTKVFVMCSHPKLPRNKHTMDLRCFTLVLVLNRQAYMGLYRQCIENNILDKMSLAL